MNRLHCTICVAALLAVAPTGAIAQMNHDHSMTPNTPMSFSPKSALSEGEVQKLDRANGTITLKHGPLIALNMPAMTMTFVAKQPTLLANVKVGDKVRFTPEMDKAGTMSVSTLELVKN